MRALNDAFRLTFQGGTVVVTQGVDNLPTETKRCLLTAVRAFDAFTPDNDPYGEHDFGSIAVGGEKFFWKIDCYDPVMCGGSENPADPAKTSRVLTIMRADEY